MVLECRVCGADDPKKPVTINDSESQYFSEPGPDGISNEQVVFDVEFVDGDTVLTVNVCEDCYKNDQHLTDEYSKKLA